MIEVEESELIRAFYQPINYINMRHIYKFPTRDFLPGYHSCRISRPICYAGELLFALGRFTHTLLPLSLLPFI